MGEAKQRAQGQLLRVGKPEYVVRRELLARARANRAKEEEFRRVKRKAEAQPRQEQGYRFKEILRVLAMPIRYPDKTVRNIAKRFRQGRATWETFQDAMRAAVMKAGA